MTAFTLDMSGPFQPGTGATDLGGPNVGGHQPPHWYEQYGMDFGAPEGTLVRAAFDAHVTRYNPHDPAADTPKVYGAQIFMRAPNDMMGGYYTHIADVPAGPVSSYDNPSSNSVVASWEGFQVSGQLVWLVGVLPVRRHAFSYLPPHALHWARKRAVAGPICSLGSAGYSALWIFATSRGVAQVQERPPPARAAPVTGVSTYSVR